jgi:hypothetical protein
MKQSLHNILRWSPPSALAVAAIGYSIYRGSEMQYWDGAVGNWLATLLGIVTGVPVALYLERRRSAAEVSAKAQEAKRVRRDTLTLILGELADAQSRVMTRLALKDSIPIDPMKMSIWNAMRDSGSLAHISDPTLLSCIADAYRLISILNDREKHTMTVIYGVNVTFPDGENAGQKLLKDTSSFHGPLLSQVAQAIEAITNALNSETSPAR